MQQAQYTNLENIQQTQQSSQNQDLQQQLINETNEKINLITVLISPSENMQGQTQYQQYQLSQQHQVAPFYPNQNHDVVPFQNPQSSNSLKDQDFSKQKCFLCGILGIYILWSIIFYFLFINYLITFYYFFNQSEDVIYFYRLILFSFTTILLAKLGTVKNFRDNAISFIILFVVMMSYFLFYKDFFAVVIVCYFSMFEDKQYYFIVIQFLKTLVFGNFIFNFILLFYLIFAEKKLKMIYPISFELFGILIFSYLNHPAYLFCTFFMLPYAISLINAFSQIINGRFQLKKNQIFAGAIASFYCQIICCAN